MTRSRMAVLALMWTAWIASFACGAGVDSPKAALRLLYEALEAGDAAGVRAVLSGGGQQEVQLIDAFAQQMIAARALGEAMRIKFAATGDALSKGIPTREQIAQLDKAKEKVVGDRATVEIPGAPRPLRLVRSEGGWKVDVGDFAGASPDNIAAQIEVLRDLAKAYSMVTAELQADKFATPQDAQRALSQRLQGVLTGALRKKAATRPATTTSRPAR